MPASNRVDNAYITVSITDKDGVLNLGRWDGRSGGESDSAATTYARAGVGGRTALGGRQEVANVMVKRELDAEMQAVIGRLRKGAGKAAMQVTEQACDNEEVVDPTAPLLTWRGVLKKVHETDRDAETNAAEVLELEMVVDGEVIVT